LKSWQPWVSCLVIACFRRVTLISVTMPYGMGEKITAAAMGNWAGAFVLYSWAQLATLIVCMLADTTIRRQNRFRVTISI